MWKLQSKIILFIALILVLIKQDIFAYEVFVNNKYICEKQKGIWREFGDDCADICEKKIEHLPICTKSVAMFSCDCGKNKCWNNNNEECVPIKEYQALIEKEEEERKKIAEEKKKQEEEKKKLAENKNIPTTALSKPDPNQINSSTPTESTPVSDPNADFIAFLSQTCRSFGGEWKNFGNSCAGTCEAKANNSQSITCSAIASDSCDCGEGKCWYQNKCIKIEEYQQQKAGNNSNSNNNSTNSNDAKINPTDNATTTTGTHVKGNTEAPTAVPTSSDKPINNLPTLPEIEQKNKTN